MLRLFRRIRKGLLDSSQARKYLLYAAGEVLLVMIGILLALQVNNWNERQKTQNLIKAYASSLILDLENDIVEVKIIQGQIKEYITRIDSLANYTRNKQINELSNLLLFPLTMGDNMYRPYSWNRTTLEDLRTSGVLRFKGNESLSEKIVAYEALTLHLEEDYEVDLELKESVSRIAGRIIDLNYSNFKDLAYYGNINRHIMTYDFSTSEAYRIAKNEELTLLTDSMVDVDEMVNGYLKLRVFLDMRVSHELPRLIKQANEIVDLLKKTYLK